MTDNFLSNKENKISNQFEKNGYILFKIKKNKFLIEIHKIIKKIILNKIKIKKKISTVNLLNNFHKYVKPAKLNKIRLHIYNKINKSKKIKKLYYLSCKNILDVIVGNELVMQKRINLSIQLPNDGSSLLPLHSDIWSGDSPFEAVVWIPLVDCYKTKSMYILKANKYRKFEKNFKNFSKKDSSYIFKKIQKDLKWINIKKGYALIFNQSLPHGNVINLESETRWSLNCRFKSLFSPYGDKKISEFFEPITLKKMSEMGMNYKFPGI